MANVKRHRQVSLPSEIVIGSGDLFKIHMWKTDDGKWHYDGPVDGGPAEVRKSGRGPFWTGPISEAHAREVLRLAEQKGLSISPSATSAPETRSKQRPVARAKPIVVNRNRRRAKRVRVKRGSSDHFLRRNAKSWQRRHPGKTGWTLTPPIPGTQVGQDLYIAKTQPAQYGYPELESVWGVFASRPAARSGNPVETLASYHDAHGVTSIEKRLGDVYKFHRLASIRGRK